MIDPEEEQKHFASIPEVMNTIASITGRSPQQAADWLNINMCRAPEWVALPRKFCTNGTGMVDALHGSDEKVYLMLSAFAANGKILYDAPPDAAQIYEWRTVASFQQSTLRFYGFSLEAVSPLLVQLAQHTQQKLLNGQHDYFAQPDLPLITKLLNMKEVLAELATAKTELEQYGSREQGVCEREQEAENLCATANALIAELELDKQVPVGSKPPKMKKQVRVIVAIAEALDIDLMVTTDEDKARIQQSCLKLDEVFSANSFKRAWQVALNLKIIVRKATEKPAKQ
ncbi:hypothetical protein [Silvimonas iriomotensis]|uniref:Uncharacterized protein n=1 Tax=Silvimonas iriomotensis TaxID=449662 RepID=A0ABQ2P4K6_9NEIS|nr:hypothetical protein [Silvimonas iriomotensis]GGP18154.1 hypothetical protein GCM10010970_03450 [Silvimonas iriomotensis]